MVEEKKEESALSSNKEGRGRESKEKRRWWFSFCPPIPRYHIKHHQDDKYLVFWLCSNLTHLIKRRDKGENEHDVSLSGHVPLALEGDEGEERITGFFKLLLGL